MSCRTTCSKPLCLLVAKAKLPSTNRLPTKWGAKATICSSSSSSAETAECNCNHPRRSSSQPIELVEKARPQGAPHGQNRGRHKPIGANCTSTLKTRLQQARGPPPVSKTAAAGKTKAASARAQAAAESAHDQRKLKFQTRPKPRCQRSSGRSENAKAPHSRLHAMQ